jgi:carotenoid cleavage dioxygenase-like enzyme
VTEEIESAEKTPPWLVGNFAPIFDEVTQTAFEVTGSIPPELSGRFLRNGPNPQTGESAHHFLGNGMVHGIELRNGKANWYRNRYVRTPLYEEKGADPLSALGDLTKSLAHTHIIGHAGKILALEELHLPYQLTPDLDTVGPYNFDSKLNTGMTAHPKRCGESGELMFFAYGVTPPYLTYHRASTEGVLVQSEEIEVKGATMVHDFNITRNFAIFMDLPVLFDIEAAASNGFPIRWSDDYGARLGVMPRNGRNQDVVWYNIDPCYVYHPMNAYEDGDELVIDVCRLAHSVKADVEDPSPFLHRWTIDQATGKVSETQLDDNSVEFPRVPDSLVGLPYRYGYTADFGDGEGKSVGFRKYDMRTGGSTFHELKNGRNGGEPVFVPAENASAEDDGYLLSYVYDPAANKSELVVLDASKIESEPIARVHLQTRVPEGFHGSWVADLA